MAVGKTLGLSHKSTLVLANIPRNKGSGIMILSAWSTTLKDIVDHERRGNAVITASVLVSKTKDTYLK
jgi:hypothetical protein